MATSLDGLPNSLLIRRPFGIVEKTGPASESRLGRISGMSSTALKLNGYMTFMSYASVFYQFCASTSLLLRLANLMSLIEVPTTTWMQKILTCFVNYS